MRQIRKALFLLTLKVLPPHYQICLMFPFVIFHYNKSLCLILQHVVIEVVEVRLHASLVGMNTFLGGSVLIAWNRVDSVGKVVGFMFL